MRLLLNASRPWKRFVAPVSPPLIFNRHFLEFIKLLEKHRVEYMVVGGYAVGFHGFPRYTGDLDLFVALSESNAASLLRVYADFGFSDLGLSVKDFLETDTVVEIGREPLKIQVLTGIDGVTFAECYARKTTCTLDGVNMPFISMEDLLRNKAASPRAKDKIDLEELGRVRRAKNG
jgi:predicted nucleotidyltransferase